MKAFNNIGQSVKVQFNGVIHYGQLKDGYLFNDSGTIKVPAGAEITEHKTEPILSSAAIFLTDDPETPYERFQVERHGNYTKEDQSAETHDDLKQWHKLDV